MDLQYFDDIVDVMTQLGGYSIINAEGKSVASFKTPSFPLKIGLALEKCERHRYKNEEQSICQKRGFILIAI